MRAGALFDALSQPTGAMLKAKVLSNLVEFNLAGSIGAGSPAVAECIKELPKLQALVISAF